MKASATLCFLLCVLPGLAVAKTSQATAQKELEAVIHGAQRTPSFVARDKYRHPDATLTFFGIRPDMRVVEVLPGGGWYTEILAPYLRDHGQLIEATPPQIGGSSFSRHMAAWFAHKLAGKPNVYGRVKLEPFELPNYMSLGAPDSADMVLTFRNMHDLIFSNVHGVTTDAMLQRFLHSAYQVLKPGGVLGIVAHRAKADMPPAKSHLLGRLPQAFVIKEAEEAGFRLAGISEVNANPKDPRTFPVWYLPPSLAQKGKDRAKYESIGEADNMTLKFIKPGSSSK